MTDNIEVHLAEIKTILKSNTKMTEDMHRVIYENGLITGVALNNQAIKRIWWWLGSVSLAILGIAGCVIKKIFA